MHGHHGWGDDCGGGWGFGWFLPALILGRVISDAFDRPRGWPNPPHQQFPVPQPQPQPQTQPRPAAPASQPGRAALHCQNCNGALNAEFAFCPQCGARVAPPACRYCGQALKPEMAHCPNCGGPTR